MGKWYKIDEKRPKLGSTVLVACKRDAEAGGGTVIDKALYTHIGKDTIAFVKADMYWPFLPAPVVLVNATHWMEIPELPSE